MTIDWIETIDFHNATNTFIKGRLISRPSPGVQIFNEIRFDNLRGDLFGGVTAAIIALPMALAFGVASGAGAEAGLYGAVLIGLFAAAATVSPATRPDCTRICGRSRAPPSAMPRRSTAPLRTIQT